MLVARQREEDMKKYRVYIDEEVTCRTVTRKKYVWPDQKKKEERTT